MNDKARFFIEANSMDDFIEQHSELVKLDWKILRGRIEDRANRAKRLKLNTKITDMYKDNVDKKIDDNDVISYCDVMILIKRLIEEYLKLQKKDYKELHFYMEMMIPYSEGKRIDFVIAFKKTIILVEFSYCDNNEGTKKYNESYHEKLTQVIHYQTLLTNVIDPSIKVVPYVFLYRPEYDSKGEKKLRTNNNKKLKTLAELVKKLYSMDTTAMEEINKLKPDK